VSQESEGIQRSRDALRRAEGAAGEGRWLTCVRELGDARREAELVVVQAVHAARAAGEPWEAIGDALGVSKQAAQQRFGGAFRLP